MKIKGKEFREKYLLEPHHSKILNETENDKCKRKKINNRIIKNQYQQHKFHYLARHAGKGIRENIKKLHIKDF